MQIKSFGQNINTSPWSKPWYITLFPVYFIYWWYLEFVPYVWKFLNRVMEIFTNITSIKLVIKNFLKPWKNSYTPAGWISGLMFKALYLIIIGPIWILARILTLIIFLLIVSFWILPIVFLVLFLII